MRAVAAAYIQLLMGTPLLMQLFLMYFGPPALLGVEGRAPWVAAAIALTLNSQRLPGRDLARLHPGHPARPGRGGRGAGACATSTACATWSLPQAVRISLPPTVGFLVQLVKATSLASIIGFIEVTRAGQIINNATFRPALVFGIVAAIYFVLCWPMSRYAASLERRYEAAQAR